MAHSSEKLFASRYRLSRILGRGGMALVYEALDVTNGRRVALKILDEHARRDPEIVARFAREAHLTKRLPTSFLPRVLDEGETDTGARFLAMEVLDGVDLGVMLRDRGTLPWPEAVAHVVQACAGIAAAHDAGIIHRDLKPSNLFVERTPNGARIRVLDFGVSKDMSSKMELTLPATVLGTAAYMSPEQLRDSAGVDARADVWSLGAILYRAIIGVTPVGGSAAQIIGALIDETPLPLVTRPDVPRELSAIIARALEKDPRRRPSSVRAFARDLAPFAAPSTLVDVAMYEIAPRAHVEDDVTVLRKSA